MTYIMPQDPTNSKPTVSQTQNSAINPQNCIEKTILPLLPAVDLSFILIHLFFLPKLDLYMCFQLPEVFKEMKIEQQLPFHFLLSLTYFLSICIQ